ncbi:MAG TPA: TetR/AcrR family transcriptional regulator [Candidatus Binatia bacterium]|nr:TetR/AcrR family transcriptional regulator [Candidatus Binatia bacterium]
MTSRSKAARSAPRPGRRSAPSAKDRAAARTRLTGPDRRRQLLAVAQQILAREGADHLSLPYLAERAGVSKPVVYDHFPTRQALVTALIREYAAYVLERIWASLEGAQADPASVVRATTKAYFDCIEERGISLARLWASAAGDPDMEHWRQRYRDKLYSLFAETFAPATGSTAEEAKLSVAMLIAACEAAIEQWEAGLASRELAEEMQVELVLAVLRVDQSVRDRLAKIREKSKR